jgi:hypothetical protein
MAKGKGTKSPKTVKTQSTAYKLGHVAGQIMKLAKSMDKKGK